MSIFNGAEQIQPVLEELSRVTGTAFVEVSVAEEDTTIQCSYAQAVDGIVLDTEGYTPGGGSEVIPGTVILASHSMEDIRLLCDTVHRIQDASLIPCTTEFS